MLKDVGTDNAVVTFAVVQIHALNVTDPDIAAYPLRLSRRQTILLDTVHGGNAPQMLGVTMTNYLTQYLRRAEAVTIAVVAFFIAAVVGALYVVSVSRRDRHAL